MSLFPSWKPFDCTEGKRKWQINSHQNQTKRSGTRKRKSQTKDGEIALYASQDDALKNDIDKIEIRGEAAKSHFKHELIFFFATNNTYIAQRYNGGQVQMAHKCAGEIST